MRKRYQQGSLFKRGKNWVVQWRENGHRRKRIIGRVSAVSKSQALSAMAAIVEPLNARQEQSCRVYQLEEFVNEVFLPAFGNKWKVSTAECNEQRLSCHVLSELGGKSLASFSRSSLQGFLDRKAESGLSFSVVDHLRWDLRSIFEMAVSEGALTRNPARLLFTPRDCPRPNVRAMTLEEVKKLFDAFSGRERLIVKLAVLSGLRPGEIFGLAWAHLNCDHVEIRQRVYRGRIDSPKTVHSSRHAALPEGLIEDLAEWRKASPDTRPQAWVFPSEAITTPLSRDNWVRRYLNPTLEQIGLEDVTFQVMRRTHSCLLKELDIDPQVRAEQMGHTVDVNENVYTKTSLAKRKAAVNTLEQALKGSKSLTEPNGAK